MNQGEIITLQPGAGTDPYGATPIDQRADWTPHAQAPDPNTGIMAHTPDPTAYHDAGGRTMLPRATRNYGSQGFVTTPGIVNVDPTDPVRGTGGFTVDMEKITKQSANAAAQQSGGNPYVAWQLAAGAQAAPHHLQPDVHEARTAPVGYPGYVVPHATPGGSQVPIVQQPAAAMTPAAQALGGGNQTATVGTVSNPSVKKPGGSTMPIPAPVPTGGAHVPVAPHPNTQVPGAPPAGPPPGYPPPGYPPQAQPPLTYPPQPAPVYPTPPAVQQAPPPYYPPQPPPQPPQVDPTQAAILQALQGLTNQIATMNSNGHASAASPEVPLSKVDWQAEKDAIMREKALAARTPPPDPDDNPEMPEEVGVAAPEGTGLDFLTNPPSSPTVQVVFDLGIGGRHLKRFHHISVSGFWLTMIYDSRYEGDQFVPAQSQNNEDLISISFPQHGNRTVQAMVPNGANQRVGCMDMINFIIIKEATNQQQTAPMLDVFGSGGDELRDIGTAIEGLTQQ